MNRLVCAKCGTTHVYATDAAQRRRTCAKCNAVLFDPKKGEHPDNTFLNDREMAWSERLLLSVYPEGVIT